MTNFYSKELKINNDIIVIECRRYRKQGRRWSVKVLTPFNGREKSHDVLVNKHYVRQFLLSYGA